MKSDFSDSAMRGNRGGTMLISELELGNIQRHIFAAHFVERADTEQGRCVPDSNNALEMCFRAVIGAVRHKKIGRGTLVIGGKSMGGRIAAQVAAASAPGVEGLVFLGYPLHPPGSADQLRAKHLPDNTVLMLFVQGSRDAFGSPGELRPIIKELKAPADLYVVKGGNHSFKVLKRAGVTQEDAYNAVLDRIELWLRQFFAK
jgi:uncharacterized protein